MEIIELFFWWFWGAIVALANCFVGLALFGTFGFLVWVLWGELAGWWWGRR